MGQETGQRGSQLEDGLSEGPRPDLIEQIDDSLRITMRLVWADNGTAFVQIAAADGTDIWVPMTPDSHEVQMAALDILREWLDD